MCSNKCSSLVAVGFESGKSIYERTTGKMRGKFTAHFKRVVKMQFTTDGSSLITCSEDTAVSAWSVCEALKNNDTLNNINASSSLEPMKSWTSHQLQVTDVCCSKSAGAGADLVASCSIDRTARVFSMTHGTGSECLATFGLPKALTAICMDGEVVHIRRKLRRGDLRENINGRRWWKWEAEEEEAEDIYTTSKATIQTTTTEEEKKKLKKKKNKIKKRATTTIENEGEGRTKTNRSRPTAATIAPSSLYTARRTGTTCSPPRKTAPAVCGTACGKCIKTVKHRR